MEYTEDSRPTFYVLDANGGEVAKYPDRKPADEHAAKINGRVDPRTEPHPVTWHKAPDADKATEPDAKP